MILSTGQVLKGRNASYRLLDALRAPTVFKAQVLDTRTVKSELYAMLRVCNMRCASLPVPSAVVKTALEPKKKDLRRERNNYLIPGIRSSPYIRKQYDILKGDPYSGEDPPQADETATAPSGMVFEWMEHDLWHVPSERFRQNSTLPKVICRSVLSALALLKTQYDAIHTGW